MTEAEADLLAAFAAGDTARMIALYCAAADATSGQERAFLLTQAHVFAIEIDHPDAPRLRADLIALGCELPL